LADTAAGWRSYAEHLSWLMADEGRQKEAAFDRMSRGWALGDEEWQRAVAKDFKDKEQAADWGGEEVAELNRLHWRERLERGAAAIGASLLGAAAESKSAPWKIALAAWLKRGSSVPNRWISEHLHMGPPDAVSRYVGEVTRGEASRAEARAILERLPAIDHKG
jgi:hypothetical protein